MQDHPSLPLLETAVSRHRLGKLAEAKALYRQVLRSHPRHPDALYLHGILCLEEGDTATAERLLLKALREGANRAEVHYSLGKCRVMQRRWQDAIAAFRRSLDDNAGNADARIELIKALAAAGNADEADALLGASLALFPQRPEFSLLSGELLGRAGKDQDAAAVFRDALRRFPRSFAICYNLGRAERRLGNIAEAAACYRKCLELNPKFAPAENNLGNCLKDLWDVPAAINHYRRAKALGSRSAFSNLLMASHYQDDADWQELSGLHQQFGETAATPLPAQPTRKRVGRSKLRLGFVSGDLGRHPVGYMLERIFPQIDRDAFSLHCFATRRLEDEMATAFRRDADSWVDVAAMDDHALADKIRRENIDVLIDLAGHTQGNRLGVFALRPSPVQMTGFGYFDTVGLPQIGYLLADRFHVPEAQEHLYGERVLNLPSGRFCYSPSIHCPDTAPAPSLGKGHATFGSFNNLAKINGATLNLWARVLHAVSGSRLVIKAGALDDPSVRNRLSAALERQGVLDRVTLAGRSPHAEYLASYAEIDVCLDPFPFGGGLTTLEALWMGVPVVSLVGPAFVSRQGLSILSYVGLPQLAVATPDDYVRAAGDLVSRPTVLNDLRRDLRGMMTASPLCDGVAHARDLEAAIRGAMAG